MTFSSRFITRRRSQHGSHQVTLEIHVFLWRWWRSSPMLTWRLPSFWNDLLLDTFYTRLALLSARKHTKIINTWGWAETRGFDTTRDIRADPMSANQNTFFIARLACNVYKAPMSRIDSFSRHRWCEINFSAVLDTRKSGASISRLILAGAGSSRSTYFHFSTFMARGKGT